MCYHSWRIKITKTLYTKGEVTSQNLRSIRSPFCGYNMASCVELRSKDLSCCLIKKASWHQNYVTVTLCIPHHNPLCYSSKHARHATLTQCTWNSDKNAQYKHNTLNKNESVLSLLRQLSTWRHPAFAAERRRRRLQHASAARSQLSIDIFCAQGTQQQK